MINIGQLIGTIILQNQFTPVVNQVIGSLANLTTSTQMSLYQTTLLGRGVREMGVLWTTSFTAPIVAASTAALKLSMTFEEVTTKLTTLGGVAAKDLPMVREYILSLAPAVGIGPVALAEAMYYATSVISDTKVALEVLTVAAKMSAIGMGSAEDVTKALAAIIKSYAHENMTAAQAGDILTMTIKKGGAEAAALAPRLANVIPFAAQLGVSFQEVGANIATVTQLGVPAGLAVTQLSSVFASLARESSRGREALAGVNLTYAQLRTELKEKGLLETLVHLREAFKGNEEKLLNVTGRLEGFRDILSSTRNDAKDYRESLKDISAGLGVVNDSLDIVKGTSKFIWKDLIAEVQVLGIRLGNELAPAFKQVIEIIKPLVKGALELVKEFKDLNPIVKDVILAFFGIVAAIGPALMFLGMLGMAVSNIVRGWAVFGANAIGAAAGTTAAGTAAGVATPKIVTLGLAVLKASLYLYALYELYRIGSEAVGLLSDSMDLARQRDELAAGAKRNLALASEVAGAAVLDEGKANEILRMHSEGLRSAQVGLNKEKFSGLGISIESAKAGLAAGASAKTQVIETESLVQSLKKAQAEVKAFTSEQKNNIAAGVTIGKTTKEIVEILDKMPGSFHATEAAVDLYKDSLKAADAEGKKNVTTLKQAHKTLEEYNEVMDDQNRKLEDNMAGWGDMFKNFTLFGDFQKKMDEITKDIIDNAATRLDVENNINRITRENSMSSANFQISELERVAFNRKLTTSGSLADIIQTNNAIDKETKAKIAEIIKDDELMQKILFANGDTTAKKLTGAWLKAYNIFGDISTILDNIPGKFAEIASVGVRTAQSIMKNLSEGDTLGAVVAGVVGGITIISKLWSKNDEALKKANEDIKKLKGTLLDTYGTFDQLEAKATTLGFSFASLWNEQGEQGLRRMQAAADHLERTLKSIGEASSKAVSGFAAVVTGMTKPWADLAKQAKEAGEKVTKALDDIDKIRAKGKGKSDADLGDELKDALANYKLVAAEYKKISDDIGITAVQNKGRLADLGVQAVATFAAAYISTGSYSQALALVAPAISELGTAYKNLGLEVEDVALQHLIIQSTVATNNPSLITAIGGQATAMQGLAQLGLLNVDTFGAMQRTGFALYQSLQAETAAAALEVGYVGDASRDALLPMQDYLHQALIQSELLGIPLDANTQMLIEQSKELGNWKEAGKTANDLLIAGMAAIVSKLDELLTRLLGVSTTLSTLPSPTVTITTNHVDRFFEEDYTSPDSNDPGFAKGTYGVSGSWFKDFGAGTKTVLHGDEAVVRRDQAGDFAAAYGGGDNEDLKRMIKDLPRALKTALTDAIVLQGTR